MRKQKQAKQHVVARQADVAAFCGVSIDAVKNWAKQGMPGKAPSYDLAEIVQWLRRDGPWKPHGREQALDALGDEILLEGGAGNSPALEKLRAAKAALAELDLQQRRGQLLSVERSKEIGLRWATLLKRMGERLGKRFGRDATAAVHDTLEECRRVLEDGYAPPANPDPDAQLVDSKRPAKASKTDKPVGRGRNRGAKRAPRR
jgi:phage terminase Nu1 subunit (DNA packaging protein)